MGDRSYCEITIPSAFREKAEGILHPGLFETKGAVSVWTSEEELGGGETLSNALLELGIPFKHHGSSHYTYDAYSKVYLGPGVWNLDIGTRTYNIENPQAYVCHGVDSSLPLIPVMEDGQPCSRSLREAQEYMRYVQAFDATWPGDKP